MSSRVLFGTRKGLMTAEKTGGRWRVREHIDFPGVPIPTVLHDARSGFTYASLNHGHFGQKMQRSKDGGKSWNEVPAPAFPPKPEGTVDVMCAMRKIPVPWNVEMVWALEAGADDGQIWCGTIPGALFVSRDHGESWTMNEALWNLPQRAKWMGGGYDWPGIHSICVDPRNKRELTLGISCGGAWLSRDDGATWENRAKGMRASYMPPEGAYDPDVQDPHRMVRCAANPDTLWVQHHNGIFVSTNNGADWMEIENAMPSNFGFAVAVNPNDGREAWFAPGIKDEVRLPVDGNFVVSRTRDGGENFEVLSKGLPDAPACHLVYRHGLEVDGTGKVLAMGSTTGSAWMSEDSGESWERLSAELPPIYCVRFAG